MRMHLALGEATAALQVYAACQARLAQELQIAPSLDTRALAEHIRVTEASRSGSAPARSSTATAERRPPSELIAPLAGRAAAFSPLVGPHHPARHWPPPGQL